LLFFLSPDCPICKTLLPALSGIRRAQRDLQIVLVSDGKTVEDHFDFVAEQKLDVFDYVISGEVGRGYGVGKLPYAVLIDEAGTVASLGMVNTREHLESLFEAKRLGVASIQEYLADDASQKLYEAK
jgi:methylamine dehydrogenase accessory protein MauD